MIKQFKFHFLYCFLLVGLLAFAGDYSATVGTGQGVSIKHITDLSHFARFIAVEPPWGTYYFHSAWWKMQTTRTELADGGYRLTLTPENPIHALDQWYAEVHDDRVVVRLEATIKQDLPSHIEYSMMAIPELLARDATFEGRTKDGKTIRAAINPEWKNVGVSLATDLVEFKLTSALGTLTITLDEGETFSVADRRGYRFGTGIELTTSCLWVGTGVPVLNLGEQFRHQFTVRFEVNPQIVLANPLPRLDEQPVTECPKVLQALPKPQWVLPTPKEWTRLANGFRPAPGTPMSIVMPNAAPAEREKLTRAALRILNDDLELDFTTEALLPFIASDMAECPEPGRILGRKGLAIFVRSDLAEHPEGYSLHIDGNGIVIYAKTDRGAFYGLQTLRQLYANGEFQGAHIRDWPDNEWRGAMIHVDKDSLRVHGELIRKAIVPLKYNQLFIECEKAAWDATKAVHYPWSISKTDLKALIDLARENYLEVIPIFQTLGHCEWMFNNGQNRDLAENPSQPYAYNPSAPGTYPFITAALDEVLELFDHPRYLHLGHDEVGQPAWYPARPENKDKGAVRLILDDIKFLHDYCQKHNVRMMIWHDMFVAATDGTSFDSGHFGLGNHLDELPKDIIFAFWAYGPGVSKRNVKRLRDAGFDVLASTWYDPAGVAEFTQVAKETGCLGVLETNWCGYFQFDLLLERYFREVAGYITQGAWAWNASPEANRFEGGRVLDDLLNPAAGTQTASGFTVDLAPYANLELAAKSQPFLLDPMLGFESLPEKDFSHCDVTFALPRRNGHVAAVALQSRCNPRFPEAVTDIGIHRKASRLFFLHTFRSLGTKVYVLPVAEYVIYYTDGTAEVFPIRYQREIGLPEDNFYTQFLPYRHNVRWEADGQPVNIWYTTWENPHPEKEIATVELRAVAEHYPFYCLAISGAD